MRVENWKFPKILESIKSNAIDAANEIMDEHVIAAKRLCPGPPTSKMIFRAETGEGDMKGFVNKAVSFIPKRGPNKGKRVAFVAKTWVGRVPGTLRASIRRVNKESRPGNVRVYAGHFRAYYAFFVEYGTVKTRKQPFMRPSFQAIKPNILPRIEDGISHSLEVKK